MPSQGPEGLVFGPGEPYHRVEIYDASWGGWRWYEGLTPQEFYSRRAAIDLAVTAAEQTAVHRYRVLNLKSGEPVRVVLPKRPAFSFRMSDFAKQ